MVCWRLQANNGVLCGCVSMTNAQNVVKVIKLYKDNPKKPFYRYASNNR